LTDTWRITAVALRDEIKKKANLQADLEAWLEKQKNKAEWYELLDDLDYSNHAIAQLLKKYGFPTANHNTVFRIRTKRGTRG
jgi:hypothetical protein